MVWAEVGGGTLWRGGEALARGQGRELSAEPHEEERKSGVRRTEISVYLLRNRIEYYTDLTTGRERRGSREFQCFQGRNLRETVTEIK